MKNFIMACAMLFAAACNNHISPSGTPYQNKEIVNEKGATILSGRNASYMMKQGTYQEWFYKNYNAYTVDSNMIPQLTSSLKGKKIEVFLGSWCGDSKREVPRMLKILESAGFDTASLHLVFVDYVLNHYKQSPQHEEKRKNIHHVPTFIIYNSNNREMGRIVESPVMSLEKDLSDILAGRNYTPNYKAVIHWQQVSNRNKKKTQHELESIAANVKPLCSSSGEFNAYGYMLFAAGNKTQAYNVFKLNTILFPDKAGTFSSLGEYYFLMGDKPSAKQCYEKVLQLKPDDANAKKMLEQL